MMRDQSKLPILWLVIPCFNEGGEGPLRLIVPEFAARVEALVASWKVNADSKVLFVDDGSSDNTWEIIQELAQQPSSFFRGIRLSRNCGHQNALLAGLMQAKDYCDISISMDCDGQDDLDVIEKMVDAYLQGSEVVYGVRSSRETDTAFKRVTAESFYKLMQTMGAEVVFNHADFRLLSRRALEGLAEFEESNLFLRGIVPMIGYPSATVEYARNERMAGESHYPLSKMLSLAINGITSLSVKPIRIVSGLGIIFSVLGIVGIIWALVMVLLGNVVAGWASTICFVGLIGGIQLLCLGVIGEYIAKIYLEVKRRPRYIVSEQAGDFGA